jgi:hypothetical protein
MTLRQQSPFPVDDEAVALPVLDTIPPHSNTEGCTRRSILEARIASQAKVIHAARELVTAVYTSGTALSDYEAEAFCNLITALRGIPPSADA